MLPPSMPLSELLLKLGDVEVKGFSESCVTAVSENSKEVKNGTVFVARRGLNFDGNNFIREAISLGACAVVTDNENIKTTEITMIISKNASKTMAEIAAALYSDAFRDMTVIGITGTKGKTSTLKILSECIMSAKKSLVTISTLGAEIYARQYEHYDTANTTPEAPFIYKILYRARALGVKFAVIEVSSQALAEYRVYGIPFTVCIFTNISRDHIGICEHRSFEDYFQAKRSLFRDFAPRTVIANANDKNWYRITEGCPRVIKVGTGCEYEYRNVRETLFESEFSLNGKSFAVSLGGEFNGINAALAIVAASVVLECDIDAFSDCLRRISVPGRYEVYLLGKIKIVIDFAHNAQSLTSLLKSVRRQTKGRIILVFGSVGERCLSRRGELASVAEKFSDIAVITSDNPGRESPEAIAYEIYSHFSDKRKAVTVTDREKAIIYAISAANHDDTVILAGKGQENYQLTECGRVYFSERDIIEKLGASKQ